MFKKPFKMVIDHTLGNRKGSITIEDAAGRQLCVMTVQGIEGQKICAGVVRAINTSDGKYITEGIKNAH